MYTETHHGLAALSALAEPASETLQRHLLTVGVRAFIDALDSGLGHEADENSPLRELQRKLGERKASKLGRATIEEAAVAGWRLVIPGDDEYPAFKMPAPSRPLALWVKGQPLPSPARTVGFVGARAATSYGEHITGALVDDAIRAGYCIASGGAYGIDGAAHRRAIQAGGHTIAWLSTARIYPAGHLELFEKVAINGTLVSEMPPSATPTKWRFLARNRLIAAGSAAVVVVEAGSRSGSINTATHANAWGTPVFAVPGPLTSAASAGTNELIRVGDAKLLSHFDQIKEALA